MKPLPAIKPLQLSLVIPTYNERENIKILIKCVHDLLKSANYRFEIIVVDDDSPDRTWEVAQELVSEYAMLRIIRRINERGLAQAVVRGWGEAKGEILAVMDGDLQHPPETLVSLVKCIQDECFDVVVASRHVEGGGVRDWNIVRRGISWGASLAATKILPGILAQVRDPMSGYFALRRSVIAGRPLNPLGYKILLEVLVRGQYLSVKEIAYTFVEREHGNSKLGFRQTLEFIIHLSRLWWITGELKRSLIWQAWRR
jgi:dolichol-phosphate mannosyltransferase